MADRSVNKDTYSLSDFADTYNLSAADIGDVAALTTTAGTLTTAVNELDADVGVPASLTTTAKGSLVAAVNELDGEIGVLSSLGTTAKSTIVAAVNELDTILDTRGTIFTQDADSIAVTGGTVSGLSSFSISTGTIATFSSTAATLTQLTVGSNGARMATNRIYLDTDLDTWLASASDDSVAMRVGGADKITLTNDLITINDEVEFEAAIVEKISTVTSSATPSIDLSLANNFKYSLSQNSTFTFNTSNLQTLTSGSDFYAFTLSVEVTGAYTVTWPGSVEWSAGQAPPISTTNGDRDVFSFFTYDGGSTWIGTTVSLSTR